MNAGLSRFILLSAALHLGVLAAWGTVVQRPPALPATLSVALYEDSPAPTVPRHRDGAAERAVMSSSRHSSARHDSRDAAYNQSPHASLHLRAANHDEGKPPADSAAEAAAAMNASESPLSGDDVRPNNAAEAAIKDEPPAAATQADSLPPTDTTRLASQLESRLRQAIAPYFVYPAMARRNGWQGQVEVGLRVEADGRLSHVRITQSSGHRLLDSAALTTLNGIDTLPGAAGWLGGRHFDMVLPIEYRLIGGQS